MLRPPGMQTQTPGKQPRTHLSSFQKSSVPSPKYNWASLSLAQGSLFGWAQTPALKPKMASSSFRQAQNDLTKSWGREIGILGHLKQFWIGKKSFEVTLTQYACRWELYYNLSEIYKRAVVHLIAVEAV